MSTNLAVGTRMILIALGFGLLLVLAFLGKVVWEMRQPEPPPDEAVGRAPIGGVGAPAGSSWGADAVVWSRRLRGADEGGSNRAG